MSQGSLRSPAQPSDIRRAGQLHLWLSSSCRQALSSWCAGITSPWECKRHLHGSPPSPSKQQALLSPPCCQGEGCRGRERPHSSQAPTLPVAILLGRSSRSTWKDWIAYVFLILLPPVAGPEIACNPHLCHAPRISFSCTGSALCVRAQRPRCSPGSSKVCTGLLLCALGTPKLHQEPRPAGNMWAKQLFHEKTFINCTEISKTFAGESLSPWVKPLACDSGHSPEMGNSQV